MNEEIITKEIILECIHFFKAGAMSEDLLMEKIDQYVRSRFEGISEAKVTLLLKMQIEEVRRYVDIMARDRGAVNADFDKWIKQTPPLDIHIKKVSEKKAPVTKNPEIEMLNKILNINDRAFGLKGFDVKRLKEEIREALQYPKEEKEKVKNPNEQCESCKNPSKEMHSCPYQEEINDDSESLCNCCDDCAHECAQDI